MTKDTDYSDVGDDWIYPHRKDFRLACCECGLIHRMRFRLVPSSNGQGKSIEVKWERVKGRRPKRPIL